uniref:Ion channel n=1 Tax=Syphacia muris TaxID=451379 RepID=A0A158R4T3_9BILA
MLNFIQQFRRIQNKLHLDSSLPFITLVSYTIVGAALFRALEFERDRIEREHFKRAFKFALNHLIEKAVNEIYWLLSYLNLTQVVNEKIEQSPWSWYGSMFYAGQLYTTIGYGLPVAKTRAGQILSIFYILAGIPIFLIILKNVGKMFSKFFRKLYKRIKSMYLGNLTVSVGDAFPIAIAFAILIIWIFFSAAMFCLWETQWGFLTSVYFFCVSISTVGLGDVVPSNKNMMLANFILILFGLALLSMCFDVIQVSKVKKSWRITDRIRDWIASQVVCRLISSKLEMHNYDSDSDDEFDSSFDGNLLDLVPELSTTSIT